jgi:hypothetical protein
LKIHSIIFVISSKVAMKIELRFGARYRRMYPEPLSIIFAMAGKVATKMETRTKTQSQIIVGPRSALDIPSCRDALKVKLRQTSDTGTLFQSVVSKTDHQISELTSAWMQKARRS